MSFRLLKEIGNWTKALFGGKGQSEEAKMEMEMHLDFMCKQLEEEGLSPKEAMREAKRRFGNVEYLQEDCRASWGVRIVDDLVNDIRYAWRQILKSKVHAGIIIATLAVCMGSNTTAYNFVMTLVAKPYPYENPDRVLVVGKQYSKESPDTVNFVSVPHYKYIEEQNQSFSSLAFVDDDNKVDLDIGGKLRRISVDRVTSGVWDVTGTKSLLGRLFDEEDIQQTEGKIVVLSERFWKELGGEGKNLIGESLLLDNVSHKVLGVAPSSFYLGFNRADIWVPRTFIGWELNGNQRNNHSHLVLGKLKEGLSLDQAKANLGGIYNSFLELYPEDKDDQIRNGTTFSAVEANNSMVGQVPQIGMVFRSIQVVTFVVLLIGCLNVGGMIMVKGFARIQEMAMRKALGASIFRLARQIYVEIFIYFLFGGLFSVLILRLAYAAAEWARLDEIPWAGEWTIDMNSLYVTGAIALGTALLTGLVPLISVLKKDLMKHVKSVSRTMSGSKHRMHGAFVISQVSLSVILLVTAFVFSKNLQSILEKSVGFESEGRIGFVVPQPSYRFAKGKEGFLKDILPFQERVIERLQSIPGVQSVSASNRIPIGLDGMGHSNFSMSHYKYSQGESKANALRVVTLPGYFETVGTRILLGRDFENTDTFDTENVIIISQNTMERYYQGMNPVGMTISVLGRTLKIIGVAEQVQDKPHFMQFDRYTLYFPFKQWHDLSQGRTVYVTHVKGDAEQHMKSIERAILELDAGLTVDATLFETVFDDATFIYKIPLFVSLLFSALALILTGLGLYGLVSFIVAESTKENAVRMALGAGRGLIMQRVFAWSGRFFTVGIVVGLAIAYVVCFKLNPIFKDINTTAAGMFVLVAVFVIFVCLLSSLVPAIKATRININTTLRS